MLVFLILNTELNHQKLIIFKYWNSRILYRSLLQVYICLKKGVIPLDKTVDTFRLLAGIIHERITILFVKCHDEFSVSEQRGFTKDKSCLTNLISLYDEMTGWVDEWRVVDVVSLDFSKVFDNVSHNILKDKLRKCGLDEWTVR